MNILYIHQHFKTPEEPGGTRSYWIAKELIDSGHSVQMLASTSGLPEVSLELEYHGIKVKYFRVNYSQSMGFFRRVFSFLSFMWKCCLFAIRSKKFDMVFATSTPLTVGIPALVLNRIKGVPFIFEVRDLWPEVPIKMGWLNNPVLIFLAQNLEKRIYKKASKIIALSPGMLEGVVDRVLEPEKVLMVPNMAKIDQFYPREHSEEIRAKFNLRQETFKIIYFGSMGEANDLEGIVRCAIIMKKRDDIEFVLLGAGSQEVSLKKLVYEHNLTNFKFISEQNMATTSEIVNLCDVSIVSFKNVDILSTNSPNKLFDSLSAGKPIIVNSNGWTKRLVEDNKCGYYYDPERIDGLVELIEELVDNRDDLRLKGINARLLAETKYDKSILCKQVVDCVNKTLLAVT